MKKKILLFSIIMMGLARISFGVDATATLPTITATPGSPVSLALTVTDFTNCSSIGLVITIDPTALVFTGLSNINGNTPGLQGNYNSGTSSVNIAWSASNQPFPNVTGILCKLNFNYLGPASTSLVFAPSCQVTTGLPPLDLTVIYTNGQVNTTNKPLNVTVFLEGLYNSGTGTMNQSQDCIDGANTFNKFTGTTVDTVSILLAAATSPWGYVYQAHNQNVGTSGLCTVAVPSSYTGNYYIVVRQRQCVETWSANAVSFAGSSITYNFTDAAGKAYGNNQQLLSASPVAYGLYSGDVTSMTSGQDGYVDIFDNNAVFNETQSGSFGYLAEDLNGDAFVDIFDMVTVFNNMQNSVGMNTPPNPAK